MQPQEMFFAKSLLPRAVLCALGIAATASAETRYRADSVGTLPPYGSSTSALAINGVGQVAGYAYGFRYEAAYLWTRGAGDGVPGNPQMKDLGLLENGWEFNATAYGVNSRGQVVGNSDVGWFSWKKRHAFIWQNGRMSDLGTLPGGLSSTAHSINESGKVVGWADTSGDALNPAPHAFFYDPANGRLEDIGVNYSYAYSINNLDQVVGSYTRDDMSRHAFFWDRSSGFRDIHDLVKCGGVSTEAVDINDRQQLVGYCLNADRTAFAFFYDLRTNRLLTSSVPGSRAAAVNNHGQAVGLFKYDLRFDHDHAMVWNTGTNVMTDLNDVTMSSARWTLFQAWDINDNGQIVGFGSETTNFAGNRGFVLTPDSSAGLLSLTVNPPMFVGGRTATGTITLTGPAPVGGITVHLSHFYWFVARIPPSVTVPEGASAYQFDIPTWSVSSSIPIELTAEHLGVRRSFTFTVVSGW